MKSIPSESVAIAAKAILVAFGVMFALTAIFVLVVFGFVVAATAPSDRMLVIGVAAPVMLLVGGAIVFAFFFPSHLLLIKPLDFYRKMEARRPEALLALVGGSVELARTLSTLGRGRRLSRSSVVIAVADESGLEFWVPRSPEHALVRFRWSEVEQVLTGPVVINYVSFPGVVIRVSADGAVHELPLAVSSVRDGTLAGATEDEMAALAERIDGLRRKAASAG